MVLLGAAINGVLATLGAIVGVLLKKRVSKEFGDFLMPGLALVVLMLGVRGMVAGGDIVVCVLSIASGAAIGYALHLDAHIRRFGDWVQKHLDTLFGGNESLKGFSEGFVTSSILICIGSMALMGSLQSGLHNNHSILITKAVVDMIVVAVMAMTMGVGVVGSGPAVFLFEGLVSLGASALAPFLTDTSIEQMLCAGSLLLVAVGLNMLNLTDIKVANYLPAFFTPVPIAFLVHWASNLM